MNRSANLQEQRMRMDVRNGTLIRRLFLRRRLEELDAIDLGRLVGL
jgi:hypothetical protein